MGKSSVQNDYEPNPPAETQRPLSALYANPAHISAEIDAALHHTRGGSSSIEVTAVGGLVTLNGTVLNADQRDLAGDTAARSAGTTDVANNLLVA